MSDITPVSIEIQELLEDINNGTLAMPEFQRRYEWKLDSVKELIDSILHGYPIGTLLFLKYNSQFEIKKVEGSPDIDKSNVKTLIMDGQQRLTSAYQVIYGGHKSGNFFIDLKGLHEKYRKANNNLEEIDFVDFIVVKKATGSKVLPITRISDDGLLPFALLIKNKRSESFNVQLDAYKNIIANSDEEDYVNFISYELTTKILEPIFNYRIPILELSEKISMGAICRIFETLNTTGKRLDSFDICVAKFYTKFNIRSELDKKLELRDDKTKQLVYPYLNVFLGQNSNRVYILQVIALIVGRPHSKNKLAEYLEIDHIRSNWDNAIRGLETSLEMMDKFGACTCETLALVPYLPSILVISSALVKSGYFGDMTYNNKTRVHEKVRKYFFHSALALRYGDGAMSKTKEDAESLSHWLTNDKNVPNFMQENAPWYAKDLLSLGVESKGARINMIRCLMNIRNPEDFLEAVPIANLYKKTDMHHIFPSGCYKNPSNKGYKIDSIFNKTYILSKTNIGISDDHTYEYVQRIIKIRDGNEEVVKSTFSKHYINEKGFKFLIEENFDGFVESRAEEMYNYLKKEIGINIDIVTKLTDEEQILSDDDMLDQK